LLVEGRDYDFGANEGEIVTRAEFELNPDDTLRIEYDLVFDNAGEVRNKAEANANGKTSGNPAEAVSAAETVEIRDSDFGPTNLTKRIWNEDEGGYADGAEFFANDSAEPNTLRYRISFEMPLFAKGIKSVEIQDLLPATLRLKDTLRTGVKVYDGTTDVTNKGTLALKHEDVGGGVVSFTFASGTDFSALAGKTIVMEIETVTARTDFTGTIANKARVLIDENSSNPTRPDEALPPGGPSKETEGPDVVVKNPDVAENSAVPRIEVEKSSDAEGGVARVGDAVAYAIRVTNTGNETLKDISVKDDRLFGYRGLLSVSLVRADGTEPDTPLIAERDYDFDPNADGDKGEIRTRGGFGLSPRDALRIDYALSFETAGDVSNTAEANAVGEVSGNPAAADADTETVEIRSGGGSGGGSGGVTPPSENGDANKDEDGADGDGVGVENENEAGVPSEPPAVAAPGNSLIPGPNGGYIEIDENGVPLGEWHWDEEEERWIFDEYPPLDRLPQTGAIAKDEWPSTGFLTVLFLLAIAGAARIRFGKGRRTAATRKTK
jgi:fimbrial isopeptide formation D2 family protein